MIKDTKKYYTLFVILFFILINLFLYNKILFTGELLNAKDILADHYYARLGFHDGFKPFNYPLWSVVKQLGTDESSYYTPPHIPDNLFFIKAIPVEASFAWQMVTFLTLGGIFMYLLCRLIKLSYFSSMLAGLFFMLTSESVTHLNTGHYSKLILISYIPLLLFFIEKGFQERKIYNFLLAGFLLGYIFSHKHEQILFYICLLVAYYTIFRLYYVYKVETNKDIDLVRKLFFYSFIMTLLFFAISAITLLPTLNWAQHTERGGGVAYDFGITWSMPPEEIFIYFFPKIFGLSVPNLMDPGKIKVFFWGRMPFTQGISYLGIFPLFFSLLGFVFVRNKYIKIFGILMLIVFPLAMGGFNPLYAYVFQYIPGFKMFRVPRAILCLNPISVAIIAAFGSEWLFNFVDDKKKDKIKKLIYILGIGWIVILILAILGWVFKENVIEIFSNTIKWDEWGLFKYSTYSDKYEYFYESVIAFIGISGFILIWTMLKNSNEIPEKVLKALCVIVFILDIGTINDKFLSTVPVDKLNVSKYIPPGMQYIKEMEKNNSIESYRVFPNVSNAIEYNRPNSWTSYFRIIGGYTGTRNRLYSSYMENVTFDNNLLDVLNVKYIALDKQAIPYPQIARGAKLGKYIVGYVDNKIVILENHKTRSRIYAVYKYLLIDPSNVMPFLKSSNFDPLSTIVLEEDPGIKIDQKIPQTKTIITEKNIKMDNYELEVEMPESGFLVFSDAYYPGWNAYIDGEKTKIYKTDYVVRSIFVPKGKHSVKMVFRPLPFTIGAWISGTAFLIILIVIGLKIANKFNY